MIPRIVKRGDLYSYYNKVVSTPTFGRDKKRFGRGRSVATEPSKSRGICRLHWVSKSASDFDIIFSCGQRITFFSMWLLSTCIRVRPLSLRDFTDEPDVAAFLLSSHVQVGFDPLCSEDCPQLDFSRCFLCCSSVLTLPSVTTKRP